MNSGRKIDFGKIAFPSDPLSVGRLRELFPDKFDAVKGNLVDGYDNFFYPQTYREPVLLVKLGNLIEAERVVAEYAFCEKIEPSALDQQCRSCLNDATQRLESLYQEFKLADGPETARLLIEGVKEQGVRQTKQTRGHRR